MDIEDIVAKVDYLQLREFMKDDFNSTEYFNLLIKEIDSITNEKEFNKLKQKVEKQLHTHKTIRKSTLNYFLRKHYSEGSISKLHYNKIKSFIIGKKIRSQSGILEIAIMTSPGDFSCAYNCYYCPDQEGMPRSYIKEEPAVKRAADNDFDTVKQFYDRATTYSINGHPVDKIEIIVLGGTWSSYPHSYQESFVRDVFYAANTFYTSNKEKGRAKLSLKEEQEINTTAISHIIGLTIETRPDSINIEEIKRFNLYGVTRVQLGIQHTNDRILKKINRQSTNNDSKKAIKLLKDCGYKIMIHIMPNLPNSSPEKDIEMFDEIIDGEDLIADEWKIYPTSVTTTSNKDNTEVYTVIEKWYNEGKYKPYSNNELYDVILHAKRKVPEYIRIARIFRDIPLPNITGGATIPNMRQELAEIMKSNGEYCKCIRCREIKDTVINTEPILKITKYESSNGTEIFLSYINIDVNEDYKEKILAFGRLRLSKNPGIDLSDLENKISALSECALIRELHVYGNLISTFNKNSKESNSQHKGLGKNLLKKMEELSIYNGYNKIAVISGVGVRNYYKKQGYFLNSGYMIKDLLSESKSINNSNYVLLPILFIIISLIISLSITAILTYIFT